MSTTSNDVSGAIGESRFDPEQFRFDWEEARGREFEWEPGRRVRIYRPPITWRGLILSCVIVFLPFGLLFGFFAVVTVGLIWLPVALLAALVAGIIITAIFAYLHREKEVVFDWESRQARFREGRRDRTYRFSEIRQITLKERQGKHTGGGATSVRTYACEVIAETIDRKEERVARSEYNTSRVISQRLTAPMAMELAEALGLPAPSLPTLTEKDMERHERTQRLRSVLDDAESRNKE